MILEVLEQAVISQTQPVNPEFDNGRLCMVIELIMLVVAIITCVATIVGTIIAYLSFRKKKKS